MVLPSAVFTKICIAWAGRPNESISISAAINAPTLEDLLLVKRLDSSS
jgi:hypothetical protein